jgi:hypothetical protein
MNLANKIATDDIQKAAVTILYGNLNAAIDAINATNAVLDAAWYTGLSRTDPMFAAEHIPGDNFYAGHVPGLINAPVAKYPNVACIANSGTPQESTDDWGEMYTLTLAVEIMCKSHSIGDADDETQAQLEVNARVQRTMEAVHAVLSTETNRTLGGLVPKIAATPAVIVSDVFTRREEKSRGPKWFWQGARLEYAVDKYSGYDH